jgi:hypothetical protein
MKKWRAWRRRELFKFRNIEKGTCTTFSNISELNKSGEKHYFLLIFGSFHQGKEQIE